MNKNEISSWAIRFAADLRVCGEPVPLDRVVFKHLDELHELRSSGLTWTSIASIISQAGGRRRNGLLISPDQLRAGVSRTSRRKAKPQEPWTTPGATNDDTHSFRKQRKRVPANTKQKPQIATTSSSSLMPNIDQGISKDVSADEITAALSRLKKQP